MSDSPARRLSKLAKEFNVGISTITEYLHKKGFQVDAKNPNAKISDDMFVLLQKEYSADQSLKIESDNLVRNKVKEKKETISIDESHTESPLYKTDDVSDEFAPKFKVVGKIELNKPEPAKKPEPKVEHKPAQPVAEKAPEKKAEPVAEKPKKQEVAEPEHISMSSNQKQPDLKVLGKIDLNNKPKAQHQPKTKTEEVVATPTEEKRDLGQSADADNFIATQVKKLSGPTVVGRIELPVDAPKKENPNDLKNRNKKKRKRIKKDKERVQIDAKPAGQGGGAPQQGGGNNQQHPRPQGDRNNQQGGGNNNTPTPRPAGSGATLVKAGDVKKRNADNKAASKADQLKRRPLRPEVSEVDVQKQIKDTLARLTAKGKSKTSKHRRDKREDVRVRKDAEQDKLDEERSVVKVTEFVTANDLASMMDVPVVQVISTCMSLGLFVSINQRLDAETIAVVAEEFGFKAEFMSANIVEDIEEEIDTEEQLITRPPIITVMGHVDHGKTSLLDYVRRANVIAGEAGGITQHIGAYSVKLESGRQITFLDTPGHEAFTAMRARGAQVTDIAIIIVAADDSVMPQTREAINHAAAAGVPIVFAINKIDKPGANSNKIREDLANMNYLVEDWGGKYQCQEISAKQGLNVDLLLEKVLLEADILDLKANPNRRASGSVIESALDKGRGYVTTMLVQTGTLRVGDMLVAGSCSGHVKAMFNERNQKIDHAGPSEPVLILGLNGAPQAGEKIVVMKDEREAKDIANRRLQLQREQGLRTQKHITLDEIGRRIAVGNFQELNLIVKGDVDGSIEAISDALIKLSTPEIQVNVIHKAVGAISESDIMLAAASNAIVVGFQVRPSVAARKIAEKEEIDIRFYSIIYDAINEIKSAMEGMLSPEIKESIVATIEVRETFDITKVGTIAGCMVKEGKVKRGSKVRLIRDGIVIHTGDLASLKRFKDDAKEVASGYECGLNFNNYNDVKVGDIIEAFEEKEVARKL